MADPLTFWPVPWWAAIAAMVAWLVARHERAARPEVAARERAYQETRARRACRPTGGVERLP